MAVTKAQKQTLITKFGKDENDSGSVEAQIAMLTERIKNLTRHFKENPKDHNSRRGLLQLVGQRKRFLKYLNKKNSKKYKALIAELGLRK